MNLSGINTPENEMTPFYLTKTKMLYFSSEGYLGLGGLDIYKVYLGGGGWGMPEHLGSPINSSYHDVYFSIMDDNQTAHFSSNRLGAYYRDDQMEACCFDIYRADILPCDINLHAFTFDSETMDSLPGVTLKVIDLQRNETVIYELENLESSNFHIPIECEREYKITASRQGYEDAEISFMSPDAGTVTDINKLIYLTPQKVDLAVTTWHKVTLAALPGATVTLIDVTIPGMKEVVQTNPLGNDFNFKISKCHKYKLIAVKDGFAKELADLEVPCDFDESRIEKKMYLTPILLDLLPIALYFDNDEPDKRTYRRSTKKDYSETFRDYYARKSIFISEYQKGKEGQDPAVSAQQIEDFFENDVKKGYDELMFFLQNVINELEKGRNYRIILKGFASPRATSAYNKNLGARRISSVKNEFEKHAGGIFKEYIKRGLLVIEEAPIGEDLAPPTVSDDLDDVVNSIYSPEASRERRLEIIDVEKIRSK